MHFLLYSRINAGNIGRSLGAPELLDVKDHRDQSRWLYQHPDIDSQRRLSLFELIINCVGSGTASGIQASDSKWSGGW